MTMIPLELQSVPAKWPSMRPSTMPRRKRKGGGLGVKRKGDCNKKRRLERKEASATTTMRLRTHPMAFSALEKRKMNDPPRAMQRQAVKDPPVGGVTAAAVAALKDSEVFQELVELFQNPAWKEKLLKFLSEEFKPPPAATAALTEGLNPPPPAAANADVDADRLERPPETADVANVATQTNQTLPSVPKLTNKQKIRDCDLIPLDNMAFRCKSDGTTRT